MAGEDPAHLAHLRTLPCCFCGGEGTDWNPIEPHHTSNLTFYGESTGKGMGIKSRDEFAMPLHRTCHRHLERLTGPFKCWTREQLHQWQEEQSERYRPKSPADAF